MCVAGADRMNREWTETDIADLKRLRGQGLSCAKIAARLGRSRNAVAAKADRLGLPVVSPDSQVRPISERARDSRDLAILEAIRAGCSIADCARAWDMTRGEVRALVEAYPDPEFLQVGAHA
jgi:hypothetical protein